MPFQSHPTPAAPSAPIAWEPREDLGYRDVLYHQAEGIAKLTINRPEVRNAFRPETVRELIDAFHRAHMDPGIGVIILTGAGDLAFCSGGDQRIRGEEGYRDSAGVQHLNVLELQRQIRTLPKPVVAMVAGYAIGGGHVLHLVCDLQYDAGQALEMGLVNAVVPLAELEPVTVDWCRDMLRLSPTALRCLKAAFNADTDGLAGIQELAGNATALFYTTDEAQEGRDAFLERRPPDFSKFPRRP